MISENITEQKVKRKDFKAQLRKEGEVIPQGFSADEYTEGMGRRHYHYREADRIFHFCIDYDGIVKEINLVEKINS